MTETNGGTDAEWSDGPSLSFLWSKETPLSGQSLYLGGEIGSDRRIYCIPGHAPRVLVIDPDTDEVYPIGPELPGKFKWLRGVRCDDVIYGIPCHADTVLRIHVPTQQISLLPIPYHDFYLNHQPEANEQQGMTWKYHGGTISPIDGCIYAIPQSAWHVLRINPDTDECTFVHSTPLRGRYKWYGGVVGKQDGAIYGIPHNSPSIIRIHPAVSGDAESIVSLHGDFGEGGHKWHGAEVAPNGTIVAVPANADTVLCVIPDSPTPSIFEIESPDIQTGHHRSDGKYKYLGATTGTDGKVYCFPSGAERVLQVDTTPKASVKAVGPNISEQNMERLMQNKWQNGLTSVHDQCTYAIPLSAETVLKIDTSSYDPVITTWRLPAPYAGLAKWEGGVLAANGVMYCMPNNHKGVLRIAGSRNRVPKSQIATSIGTVQPLGDAAVRYRTGIATLRAAAHRVKYPLKHRKFDPKPRNRQGNETNTPCLPSEVCQSTIIQYDRAKYDFISATISLLEKCDANIVGAFPEKFDRRLEDLCVPTESLKRKNQGGQCESAQAYLSEAVASNVHFMTLFDDFVTEVVLPHLRGRLMAAGYIPSNVEDTEYYYQRPPTIRLQPGPARSSVKAHNDAEYGHQNGELNFWLPLTDRNLTGVDLLCESACMKGDYQPLQADRGELIAFHGSSCRHYVNANSSPFTRVSFDFRIGVEGYFDPTWQMLGTTNDHDRKAVRV